MRLTLDRGPDHPDEDLGDHLIQFAYLLTRDGHLAQDLVQDVMLRLLERGSAAPVERPLAYGRRAVLNAYRDHLRRESTWRRRLPTLVGDEHASVRGPEAGVVDRLALDSALAALPVKQRAALILRYYYDLDDAAIGSVLACAPATSRTLLSRGLKKLRTFMDKEPT